MDTEKARVALLLASLPHVAFDGWSQKALLAGAQDLGLKPVMVANLYPGGPAELIEAFSQWADQQALVAIEKHGTETLKVREKIALGVRSRLMVVEPHREALRRGLTFLALPGNAPLGLKCLYRTVDALWYAAGDRSTDYNYYTKRLLLSGVYSSTLLYWLNDSSDDYAATWAFLERRIENVLKVGGRLGKTMKGLLDLPDRLTCRLTQRRSFRT